MGLSCGGSETGPTSGEAGWTMKVEGQKTSGNFTYRGRDDGNGWKITGASVRTGNTHVSVTPCANPN
jgi:hypothetical protein